MTITDAMNTLGPGARIVYLQQEETGLYWCEIQLPLDRYTVTLTTECGGDEDEAVRNTVERALTEFRRTEGEVAA